MKNRTEKLIALLMTLLTLLVSSMAFAQSPAVPVLDCCQQAITFRHDLEAMTAKYNQTARLLAETREAGNDLIHQKDGRLKTVQDQANTKLTEAAGREKAVKDALTLASTRLNLVKAELENVLLRPAFLRWGQRRLARKLLKQLNNESAYR